MKPIGTLGTIPTLAVGGRVFTDLTNLKTLVGFVNGVGLNATLRELGETSGYLVPTGKVFRILAYSISNYGSSDGLYPGYGDTDVGQQSSSSPTGAVNPLSGGGFLINTTSANATNLVTLELSLGSGLLIPAETYPYIASGGTMVGTILAHGYEEDA